ILGGGWDAPLRPTVPLMCCVFNCAHAGVTVIIDTNTPNVVARSPDSSRIAYLPYRPVDRRYGSGVAGATLAARGRFRHLPDGVADCEAVLLLYGREVLERLRPLADDDVGREDDVVAPDEPVVVRVRGDVRELVRI